MTAFFVTSYCFASLDQASIITSHSSFVIRLLFKIKLRFNSYHNLLFSLLLFCIQLQAQKNSKTILDSKNKKPIEYVIVSSNDKKLKLISNKDGKVILISDPSTRSFSFYRMGYNERVLDISALEKTDTIYLDQLAIELQEINITTKMFDTIVRDKRFYVDDYVHLPNGQFLLLTYMINIPGFEVVYYRKGKGILQRKKMKNESGESLFKDCFGNFHLVTDQYSRQLFFNSDTSFEFLPKYSRSKFDSTVARCSLNMKDGILATIEKSQLVIKRQYFDSKVNDPFLTYYKIANGQRTAFYTSVYNERLMEMLKDQEGGIGNQQSAINAIGGRGRSQQAIEADHLLFYSQIAKAVYAPVFLRKDTLIIFNFQEELIVFLNQDGKTLRTLKLDSKSYSSMRDFQVFFDEISGHFYIYSKEFDKRTLNRIDLNTGKAIKKIKLEKIFASKISVHNNSIYYLVKEHEWDDTAYLYEQKI